MSESQNIEWKSSWHDDYLKWICGFANAQGGKIYIGKNDIGEVVDLSDAKALMTSIPHKIRDLLGMVCEVNLFKENDKQYIEVIIQPYSVPVSLRGRYYYRSGSTKMELTGNTLTEFLLKKSGKTWDDVVEPRTSMADIDPRSLRIFLEDAEKSGRIPNVAGLTNEEILDKLRLTENGQLKRAAIILFGKDPNRFYPNVQVKIGRFGKDDADLRFGEVEEGNLIQLLRAVPAQLNHKFLIRPITFEGMQRIENSLYPLAALREMLLNALVHRTYMGAMVQMRVYDDKLNIWNEGMLPPGMDAETLKHHHVSRPRNPLIADVCFKGGYIDLWGRGTLKIIDTCKAVGLPEPTINELNGGVLVTLFIDKYTPELLKKLGLNERQIKAVAYLKEHEAITNSQYQELNSIGRTTSVDELMEMVHLGIFTNPNVKGRGRQYTLIN